MSTNCLLKCLKLRNYVICSDIIRQGSVILRHISDISECSERFKTIQHRNWSIQNFFWLCRDTNTLKWLICRSIILFNTIIIIMSVYTKLLLVTWNNIVVFAQSKKSCRFYKGLATMSKWDRCHSPKPELSNFMKKQLDCLKEHQVQWGQPLVAIDCRQS